MRQGATHGNCLLVDVAKHPIHQVIRDRAPGSLMFNPRNGEPASQKALGLVAMRVGLAAQRATGFRAGGHTPTCLRHAPETSSPFKKGEGLKRQPAFAITSAAHLLASGRQFLEIKGLRLRYSLYIASGKRAAGDYLLPFPLVPPFGRLADFCKVQHIVDLALQSHKRRCLQMIMRR